MTQETAALSSSPWPTLAGLAFALLVVIGIVAMTTLGIRYEKENRNYVNNNPWTQECRTQLRAMTYPSLNDAVIAQNCRYIAQHGGTSRNYERIAAHAQPGTDRDRLESYLHRAEPLPGCAKNPGKCETPQP